MFGSAGRPLVIGHRGARGLYPENTLVGFTRAIALGVDAVELDVAVTADRVVVVTHDPRLHPDIARTPDGNWVDAPTPLVRELTLEQLSEYDVGRLRPSSAYAARFLQQQAVDGARIPSLQEILCATGQVLLFIEMKTSPAEPTLSVAPAEMAELVMNVLDAANALERCTLLSFDWRGLRHLRRHRPEVATGWLTQPMTEAERRLWWRADSAVSSNGSAAQAIAAKGGSCWLPEFAELRAPDVAAAQQLGFRVVPWSVERPEEINCAAAWGVDGLITDRPDCALKIVGGWKRT
jgi:glycerophosphoryl diester phosphodiesterase